MAQSTSKIEGGEQVRIHIPMRPGDDTIMCLHVHSMEEGVVDDYF